MPRLNDGHAAAYAPTDISHFPVLRSGSILREQDGARLTPEECVRIGRLLYTDAESYAERFIASAAEILDDVHKLGVVHSLDDQMALRLKMAPALTIDFTPIQFVWEGVQVETRTSATVCSNDARGKLWVRLSAVKPVASAKETGAIKDRFLAWAPALRARWIEYYNEAIRSEHPGATFKEAYSIDLFMVSSPGTRHGLRELMTEFRKNALAAKPDEKRAFDVLKKELKDAARVDQFPDYASSGGVRKVVAYSFPRYETIKSETTGVPVETIADHDYEALCAMYIEPNGAKVFGVGLEPRRPKNFRRSAAHVASGEISYELGRVF